MRGFPSLSQRLFLGLYALLWTLLLPVVLLYLRRRARRDPLYGRFLNERFGRYANPLPGAVWVHAVSLGEMRSAVPLIRALMAQGETIVTTHFTPAGRREAQTVFAEAIAAGKLRAVWVPFEFDWAYRGFFRAYRPKYGLVMETEVWPRMIASSRRHKVPLLMCNAQYTSKSYTFDRKWLPVRSLLMRGFAGMLVKSDLQRQRFESVGVSNIAVTGELRFDQPIPQRLLDAGAAMRRWMGADDRLVVTFASVVQGEDALFIEALKASLAAHRDAGLPAPLFVYVPRAPERFGEVAGLLEDAGLTVARRSVVLDAQLTPVGQAASVDVLLGDSTGEMYAYLAMADRVVVGGGFTPNGSHNISEPLALGKVVMVGPDIHTIEYPAVEAIGAGVVRQLQTPADLAKALLPDPGPLPSADSINTFFAEHSGAVAKTLAAIPRLLATSR